MKLSVSNIVWGNEKFDDFLKLLKQEGCHGIELAPSLIWNEPINSSREERQKLKKQIYNSGLEFVGFHSLLSLGFIFSMSLTQSHGTQTFLYLFCP